MDNKTLVGLDWLVVCDALTEQCQTVKGKARARTGDFAHDRNESLRRFDVIDELWTFDDDGEHPPIAAIHDIEELSERANKGEVLEPYELVAVGNTLGALRRLQSWVTERK